MSLASKFNELTSEQQEVFKEVKSVESLDIFLTDNNIVLTDEEKANIIEYLKTGMMPLDDDDMDAVTGGKGSSPDYAQMARNSGYNYRINKYSSSTAARCPNCRTSDAMFSQTPSRRGKHSMFTYDEYIKTKCFKCGLGSTGYSNSVDTRSTGDIVFYFITSPGQYGDFIKNKA